MVMVRLDAQKLGEERFQTLIEELEDYAIFLLDTDGVISSWNKGAEKIKGYTADEAIGKNHKIFYTQDDQQAGLPRQLLNLARDQRKANHEGWRVKKDGSRFWAGVTITAIHNDAGDVSGFLKVTRDLTERRNSDDILRASVEHLKQNIEELRKSEERYHKMVAEVQDYAILLLDRSGNIENWNAGAASIKGYSAHEIIGKNFTIFYAPEDVARKLPESLLEEAVTYGKANHEGWRVRKNGTRFWGSVVITALHGDNNEVIGFTKVTRDLTERKKSEDSVREIARQLDEKNKSLESLNAELSSFVYIASHDMKEPLRKIQTYISMFDEVLSEKGTTYLERIGSGAARMQALIDDLLSYSQLSNEGVVKEKLDLNEILELAKHDLEVSISQKQAVITATRLPVVKGVRVQFYQIFLNLLSNALKFATQGERVQIDITSRIVSGASDLPARLAEREGSFHHIMIRDNGIGFSSEDAAGIFEVFRRLHPKQTYSGTGIGLAIVKKVIENHKGMVVAEGVSGVGATFHLYLPVD